MAVVREPVRAGAAAALACEPGVGHGLLVADMCLAPEQVLELGALAAVIAGRSVVRRAPVEPEPAAPAG